MEKISAQNLKELKGKEDPYLLDVRTQEERSEWRIEDSLWIPLDFILDRNDEIPQDRPVYVYCRSGNRSGVAIEQLEPLGFENLINVEGGIREYEKVGGNILRGSLEG